MTRARDLSKLANSNVLTVLDNGNVGVGSTIPDVKLDVVGVVSATSFYGDVLGNINSTGISTLGNTIVGGATTELVVNGDARIVGILTIGTSSITLDGTENQVNVGTGVTLHHTNGIQVGENILHSSGLTLNQLNASGIITASSFVDDGTNLLTEINTKTSTGKAIAMSMIFGS